MWRVALSFKADLGWEYIHLNREWVTVLYGLLNLASSHHTPFDALEAQRIRDVPGAVQMVREDDQGLPGQPPRQHLRQRALQRRRLLPSQT